MKRTLLCLLLALTMLLAAGCADWEVTEDPLGELSDFYQNENEEPEPEPLTAFTRLYRLAAPWIPSAPRTLCSRP